MSSIKILRVVGNMQRGGIETSLMHLLRGIDRTRFTTDFAYVEPAEGDYDTELRAGSHRIFRCDRRDVLRFGRRFTEILKTKGAYDVVHSSLHRFNGYVVRLAAKAGVPIRIVHSHSNTDDVDAGSSTLRKAYVALQNRWIQRHATHGLAVSTHAARSLFGSRWRDDPRWRVVYQGRDLRPFSVDPDRAAVRRELGISEEAYVIGHIGRLHEAKNHQFLLRVARDVMNVRDDCRLLIVGDGPCRTAISDEAGRLGIQDRVVFTGDRSDIARLLKGAVDVMVFPSLVEGLPMSLIEAQAAGIPCVYSDAITPEVSVVPALVRPLSLQAPVASWVNATLSPPVFAAAEALALVSRSPFNVEESIRWMQRFYETGRFPENGTEMEA